MLDLKTRNFYIRSLVELKNANIPYLVGGAYALRRHTNVIRETKDLDLLILPEDQPRAFALFENLGYRTELPYTHWLGKVFDDTEFIDIIFNSGNGLARVDEDYFTHASTGPLFDVDVKWCPPEEMILSKSFVMERERYDGADVAHLILSLGKKLHWERLLERFQDHWRVLYAHLVLFGFIYPAERSRIPDWIMRELGARIRSEHAAHSGTDHICQGTLLSREQFLIDIQDWGYDDARLTTGAMTEPQIERWTQAIENSRTLKENP